MTINYACSRYKIYWKFSINYSSYVEKKEFPFIPPLLNFDLKTKSSITVNI